MTASGSMRERLATAKKLTTTAILAQHPARTDSHVQVIGPAFGGFQALAGCPLKFCLVGGGALPAPCLRLSLLGEVAKLRRSLPGVQQFTCHC